MEMKGQGWVSARPLDHYASLHEFSLTNWLGWGESLSKMILYIQLDLNLYTPYCIHPKATLAFKTLDADQPVTADTCFSILHINRWRLAISSFSTFDEFLGALARWHRCNYKKSQRIFNSYGATVTLLEGDWSEYADEAYNLYVKVAKIHGEQLYDIVFFRDVAKREDYQLICAWHEGKMIAMFVLQVEEPALHSICCGMDYQHSSVSYAYSWLHYELFRLAIESKKYKLVDVGLTADQSKREICFTPVVSRMDIYAKSWMIRKMLKFFSRFVTATINSQAQLKFHLNR